MTSDGLDRATTREGLPEECQLCRLLDYRGEDINEPEGMTEIARDDGGRKIIHCCQRCHDELFGTPDWTPYETDGGGKILGYSDGIQV